MIIQQKMEQIPCWIWHPERARQRQIVLEKSFQLDDAVELPEMKLACTGAAEVFLNGNAIDNFPELASNASSFMRVGGLPERLEPGLHTIRLAISVAEPMPIYPINIHLHERSVGCIAFLRGSHQFWIASDDTWRTSDDLPAAIVCVWGEEPFGDLDDAPEWFIAGGYGDIAVRPISDVAVLSAAHLEAAAVEEGIRLSGDAGGQIVLSEGTARHERHIFYHVLKQNEWKERRAQQEQLDLSGVPELLLQLPKELNARLRVANNGAADIGILWNGAESLEELHHYEGCMTEWLIVPAGCTAVANPQGMRFIRLYISGDEGAAFQLDVRFEAAGVAMNQVGGLQADHSLLQQIYDVSVHTSEVCHQIGLWDGIKRDRLNWAYDIYLAAKTDYPLWDDYEVLRRSLRELGQTPYGYWMNSLPSYTLWWLSSIWDYYFETGDGEFVLEIKEDLLKHIAWVRANADAATGLFMPQARKELSFIEWSPMSESESWYCLNAIYSLVQRQMNRLAGYLPELGIDWDEPRAELAEDCFIGGSGSGSSGSSGSGSSGSSGSLLAALLGIKSGYVSRERALSFLQSYKLQDPLTPLSAYWLAECCSEFGLHDQAWAVIAEVWGTMLHAGATTFWEGVRLNLGSDFHHSLTTYTAYNSYRMSLCHSWSSTPVVWIAKYVLGIRALEPGYKSIAFEPNAIAGLTACSGTVQSPLGAIQVEWRLENGQMIKSARIGEQPLDASPLPLQQR